MARRQGLSPSSFLPRRLYRIEVDLQAIIDLTEPRALPEGLASLDFRSDNLTTTQAIGEAAQYLGREGILAPSAAGDGKVLAVFIDRLMPDSRVDDVDFEVWNEPS
jgi:RES domain